MHQNLTERAVDLDPRETEEWIEAFDQIVEQVGMDRAAFLMEKLAERARHNGVEIPVQLNTPYVNTIPVSLDCLLYTSRCV